MNKLGGLSAVVSLLGPMLLPALWSMDARGEGTRITTEQVNQAIQQMQKLAENLDVRGDGIFKRVSGVPGSSKATPPDAATREFAGPVDIGNGRKIYLECRGAGSPTVIFESGYRNDEI